MKTGQSWLNQHTQQAVTSRVASLHVVARFGPNTKSGRVMLRRTEKQKRFVVGESVVGGEQEVIK